MQRYAQEFTDNDTGRLDRVTFEPIEVWTGKGLEIIPSGFSFQLPDHVENLLQYEEIPLYILYEWHRTAGNRARRAAVRDFRMELIKYPRKVKDARKGRFWASVRDRVRKEVICFLLFAFRWCIFR